MRVRSLTGLRGVAAVAVMFYHIPHDPLFERFGLSIFTKSYLCVDLFFALSGFVISIGYYNRVVGQPRPGAYRDFLINRMARVFPLHLIVALAFAARFALNLSGNVREGFTGFNFLANVLMIQSWGIGAIPFAGNSWSVSTELMAYLLFPLIAIAAFSRAYWAEMLVAIGLILLVAMSGVGVRGPLDVVDGTTVLPLLRCLGGFTLGVLAYRAAGMAWCRRLLGHDITFVAVCAAMALAFWIPGGDLFVALLCPLLVLAVYYDGPLVQALLSNRLVFHLGLISYSIYLWHPLFLDAFAFAGRKLHAHGFVNFDFAIMLALVGFVWLASWISYRIVEVGGHRLIKALDERVRQRAPVLNAGE